MSVFPLAAGFSILKYNAKRNLEKSYTLLNPLKSKDVTV